MEMENPYSWRGKAVSFAFLIAMNPAIDKNCFFELLNYFLPEAYLNDKLTSASSGPRQDRRTIRRLVKRLVMSRFSRVPK